MTNQGTLEQPYMGTAAERAVAALGAAGYAAYSMTLVGHAAPMVEKYRERVVDPRPGDLVVESTTFYGRDRRGYGHVAVGRLVEIKDEFIPYDDENATEEDPGYTDRAWYVEPAVGGEVVRWTNASFIAIPSSYEQQLDWRGVR